MTNTKVIKDEIRSLSDVGETLDRSIELFERASTALTNKIDRATAAIEKIREACAKHGADIGELEKAVREANSLKVAQVKMQRYLDELKRDNPLDKKVAVLSVMVELTDELAELNKAMAKENSEVTT